MGCGCRGRELGRELTAAGHAVRGSTRDPARLAEIEEAGLEGVQADPDRLGTVLMQLPGVTAVCWLMGSAQGEAEAVRALHTDRLDSLLGKLVDSGVRGFVYEGAGTVDPALLGEGAEAARRAGERNRMPVEIVARDPSDHGGWLAGAREAVERVLAA